MRSVLGLGKAEHMNGQRLGNDFGDAHARIERSEGVLNNHLHLAALRAQLFSAQREKISRVKTEFTAVRFDQSQEHTRQGGLAAAAFADDGKVSPHLTEKLTSLTAVKRAPSVSREKTVPPRRYVFRRFGDSSRISGQSGTLLDAADMAATCSLSSHGKPPPNWPEMSMCAFANQIQL